MTNEKNLYYVGIPVLSIAMCVGSFYLGQQRGRQQAQIEKLKNAFEEFDVMEHPDVETELTFYEKLHEEKKEPKSESVQKVSAEDSKTVKGSSQVLPPASLGSREVAAHEPKKTSDKPEKKPEPKKNESENDEWMVQMGAFKDLGKAHELTDQLKNMGYDTVTDAAVSSGKQLFKVQIKAKNHEDAKTLLSRLQKNGFDQAFVKRK